MTENIRRGIVALTTLIGAMAISVNNAYAQLGLIEKEQTQTIVWIVEAVTFITTIAIVGFVWRISKRDVKNKKSSKIVSKKE